MTRHAERLKVITRFLGLESNKTGHLEKWLSGLGGLLGILSISLVSRHFIAGDEAAWVVASMGASAVLLFAVPHGPLSQPWPVLGGHVISALIGVACARWVPQPVLASALAVGIAIGCMHYLRCIHPPGGATALTAVIGGGNIQALGFGYVFTPVMLNAMVMVLIAIAFNYAFHWRRYPAMLAVVHKAGKGAQGDDSRQEGLSERDLEKALQAMNSTIDINGQDLAEIYRLARQNKHNGRLVPEQLQLGQHYSNGLYGADWQVRQIIDMPVPMRSSKDLLIYKIVAGADRRTTGTASFEAFAQWARYEVFLNENSWQRRESADR